MARRWLYAAVALLVLGWGLTFLVAPWSNGHGLDVIHFAQRADHWLHHGKLPYRDVHFEYPPLAAALIALPGAVHVGSYAFGFGLVQLVFGVATVLLAAAAARLTDGDERRAAFAVAVMPLLLGAIVRGYFDLVPTALLLGAVVAILSRRVVLGFALLGLAIATKGYPIVVVPIALAWLLGQRRRREAIAGGVAVVAVVGVVVGAVLAISPSGLWWAVHYQTARPLEVEGTPALILFVVDTLDGVRRGRIVHTYGSWNLIHHGGGPLAAGFTVLLGVTVVALTIAVFRAPGRRALPAASFAAVAAFAVYGKVFSPQYAIWIVPLFALALAWGRYGATAVALVAIVLSRVEYPPSSARCYSATPG